MSGTGCRLRLRVSAGVWVMAAGWVVVTVTGGQGSEVPAPALAAWLCAAALHEGGHLAACALTGTRVRVLTLDLLGARMETEGMMSYGQEFCVAAGGPCANLVTAALLMPLWIRAGAPAGGGLYRLILSSLGFALVNLLPVASMDGGRMLYCLACVCACPSDDTAAADRLLTAATAAVLAGTWLLSVYALLRDGVFLSLFVFSFLLLCRVLTGRLTQAGTDPAVRR